MSKAPRRKMKRLGIIISAVLLSSVLLTACNSPSILDTHGPVAAKEEGLFWFILAVATFVFVVVETILIISIVRFRERPNAPAPRQIHGNNTVELAWTIAPSIFLFAVLVGTIYTMFNLSNISGTSAGLGRTEDITVVGHQWWWEFDYPREGIVTADELVVPQGTVIDATLISNNVIHSFWVPQVFGKTDVVPGHMNHQIFEANDVGIYRGICTEYCGLQHAHMSFNLVVMKTPDFLTWVSNQQKNALTPTSGAALAGYKIFSGPGGCEGCHGIVGVNLKSFSDPAGAFLKGPNLTHFGNRDGQSCATNCMFAGAVLEWNPASCVVTTAANGSPAIANPSACGLYQWLQDPQAVKPGSDMVIGPLSPTQIAQLIAYLESLQ
jgi:cytochrome c oxidase subunit 2